MPRFLYHSLLIWMLSHVKVIDNTKPMTSSSHATLALIAMHGMEHIPKSLLTKTDSAKTLVKINSLTKAPRKGKIALIF